MPENNHYQNLILKECRRKEIPVTVFLMNGFQMSGTIDGFDNSVVILKSEGRQRMLYKHAISTIVPSRRIELPET